MYGGEKSGNLVLDPMILTFTFALSRYLTVRFRDIRRIARPGLRSLGGGLFSLKRDGLAGSNLHLLLVINSDVPDKRNPCICQFSIG